MNNLAVLPAEIKGLSIIDAAKYYRDNFGWSTLPLYFKGGKKLACCKWEKFQKRLVSDDEFLLPEWARRAKGLGIVLGSVSDGLYVRDFDKSESYARWRLAFPLVASKALTVATGRGFHVYARWKGVTEKTFEDGELRGEGCYVVAPPSIHPSGVPYSFYNITNTTMIPEGSPSTFGLDVLYKPDRTSTDKCTEYTERQSTQSDRDTDVPEETDESEVVRGGASFFQKDCASMTLSEAIQRALPTQAGQNWRLSFVLARGIKTIEKQRGSRFSGKELIAAFKTWHSQNRFLRPGQDVEEYYWEFDRAYASAKYAFGEGQMQDAWERALQSEVPEKAMVLPGKKAQQVAALCRELQEQAGSEPFYLACRTVAQLLKHNSHSAAAAIMRALVDCEIIQAVEVGGPHNNKATRYRFIA